MIRDHNKTMVKGKKKRRQSLADTSRFGIYTLAFSAACQGARGTPNTYNTYTIKYRYCVNGANCMRVYRMYHEDKQVKTRRYVYMLRVFVVG